ncbi:MULTISPECIES: hypothetical protein [Pseudomonas]|uniref:Uncharacterized protein n=1 Tax=Pseudomonas lutea TaxID=243924 RepID=A0A9X8MH04_9PSED|nr:MULTISPECIES: hypothetical protein [Pseudomonas]SER35382.1 hypothetical protein SAMN05216409_1189 [Pseudomonas lutea]
MSKVTAIELGKNMDALALARSLSEGCEFPLDVCITHELPHALVLAQAIPTLEIKPGASAVHTCQNFDQLHHVVFGIVAVGDVLGREKIGSVTTKLPKGAVK